MLFKCLFVKFCNMKEILSENKYLIILWLLCIFGLIGFLSHYSGILIDFGREVFYPERILAGDVLYKNLFNIYGPLSYQINAVLYKIFGAKLSTLYGAGAVCSILTVSGIYLVAQKFLSKFLSFALAVFTIAVGVTAVSIFNFHFPYSWAVLYGLIAFLYSLYFLLDKKNLSLSAFLAGICITCKYDFLLYGLVVMFFVIKSKDWKALLCFISAPILSYGILFLQGLKLSDLINSLLITKQMAKSKTLTYFYQNSGIYFHPKALMTDFIIFLKTAIPFGGILFGANLLEKRKNISIIVLLISTILFFLLFDIEIGFGFLPLLLLVFAAASYKKLNSNLRILLISTLCVCAKVFWVLILNSYGNYYAPIVLTAFSALLFLYVPKKLEKIAGVVIIAISILIFSHNLHTRKFLNNKIETAKGIIYTTKQLADSTNELINYIEQNAKDKKIVIFPEGMTVNFLTDTKSDDFYNSLLPLYIETFGEEKIIEHYKSDKPDYIILTNQNMKDYYFEYICKDYAHKFCGFIQENYSLERVIGQEFRYVIFMLK